jgi:SAM-dependent methyltransferase
MKIDPHKQIYSSGDAEPTYLDIQAEAGISKHMGGYEATDILYSRCHIADAQEVLDVGCGIGVGPVYMADKYGCQVIAVDISEKMLSWAEQRARREDVIDNITFRQADIRKLPFESDRFDAVIVESVLAFVKNKTAAIMELIRVTKPGGYVGLNETYWIQEPSEDVLAQSVYIGTEILSEAEWRAIWDATPLEARTFKTYHLDAKQEVRDRIEWVGWRSILAAWGRVIRLLITKPAARDAIKQQLNTPAALINALGYGLFTGRKPQESVD